MSEVRVSKRAEKSLQTVPKRVASAFSIWKRAVENHGIEAMRKTPGYHDEPLQGKLKGFVRSVRLTRGYRVYYRTLDSLVECILVEEINHHDYKKIERLYGL